MSSIFDKLKNEELLANYPTFLENNVHYEVMMGSVAYGCNTDMSDIDVYGFAVPPKDIIFPHTAGYIQVFDTDYPRFEQYQKHHIFRKSNKTEYDLTIYNIVKFFKLVMENNPNMIDALFVPERCVLSCTQLGRHVKNNRHIFLTKRVFHKFRGYAASQKNKMTDKSIKKYIELCKSFNFTYDISEEDALCKFEKEPDYYFNYLDDTKQFFKLRKKVFKSGKLSKRIDLIDKYGYDVKFLYHTVRLLLETEQILSTGDLILDRDREIYKEIRRGGWSLEKGLEFFDKNDKYLEELYHKSSLRHVPDKDSIRNLLLECLEMHYGSLDKCITNLNKYEMAIRDIKQIVGKI